MTIIESLRAYDLVFITGNGSILPGLDLLSMLVTENIIGQTERAGYGSALAAAVRHLPVYTRPVSLTGQRVAV